MADRTKRGKVAKIVSKIKGTAKPAPVDMRLMGPADTSQIDVVDIAKYAGDPIFKIRRENLERVAAVGSEVERLGTIRISNGFVIMSNEAAVEMIETARKDVMNGGDLESNSHIVARLGNAVAKLSHVFRMQNEDARHKSPKRQTPFQVGKSITVNTQNNFYSAKDEPPKTA